MRGGFSGRKCGFSWRISAARRICRLFFGAVDRVGSGALKQVGPDTFKVWLETEKARRKKGHQHNNNPTSGSDFRSQKRLGTRQPGQVCLRATGRAQRSTRKNGGPDVRTGFLGAWHKRKMASTVSKSSLLLWTKTRVSNMAEWFDVIDRTTGSPM
jgi:hypothetical protein